MKRQITSLLVVCFLSLWVSPVYADGNTREPVIGRQILISGGSSMHTYIMPVVLKAFDRSRILLGYIERLYSTGEPGIIYGNVSPEEIMPGGLELPSLVNIYYIMIDCNKKTYAHYPHGAETNSAIKIFYNGDSFKWGEFSAIDFSSPENKNRDERHYMYANWGVEEMTKLFQDGCDMS